MSNKESSLFVVTGAASGMGKASAQRLGRRGRVLLADINAKQLDQVAKQLISEGIEAKKQVCNVMDEQSVCLLAKTAKSLGQVSGIVNAAGISPSMTTDWKKMLSVDLIGTALILREFLPLIAPGGAAVCIASIASRILKNDPEIDAILDNPQDHDFLKRIEPFLSISLPSTEVNPKSGAAYILAKRGVIRLCEKLAPLWAKHGARIVSVSPGTIDTPMGRQELDNLAYMRESIEMTPMRRVGKPEEIASVVDFLCSEDASFITGCDLLVDGGYTAAMTHLNTLQI
ncbi:MAG: SDR family oxidoreductase [Proteobacteria bacterium]|nr:SDR family oxidoreductase [Pseudomonadota bacterium]